MKQLAHDNTLLRVALVGLALFIVGQFIVLPFFHAKERLQKKIIAKGKEYAELLPLSAQISAQAPQKKGLPTTEGPDSFALLSFLEEAAVKAAVKSKITYMQPLASDEGPQNSTERHVELKLATISLDDMVRYLAIIESRPGQVLVWRLTVQQGEADKKMLDVTMDIASFLKG